MTCKFFAIISLITLFMMNCDASFREMVQYANEFGGILLTRDRMDDVAENYPQFREQIKKRKLRFTFVGEPGSVNNDHFQLPQDPVYRSPITLDQFLRF